MENLLKIGLLLIFVGFILVLTSSFTSKNSNVKEPDGKSSLTITKSKQGLFDVKSAGGIFIGPFPIFGAFTDKSSYYTLLILAVIIFLIFFFLNR